MTLPEFINFIQSMNRKESCIGECFEQIMVLYWILHRYFTEDNVVIQFDSTRKHNGVCKFKITPVGNFTADLIYEVYHSIMVSMYHNTFNLSTNLKKNGTIVVTIQRL